MNPKMVRLLHEGFSIYTLENLTEGQLNLLYEKIKKEPKEATTTTTTKTTYSPEEAKGKSFKGTTTVLPDGKVEVTKEGEISEKSVSKQQQKIMGLALSVKRGDTPKSKVSKSVKDMASKMSEKDLEDFASTKHKGLPKKKKSETKENVKNLEESIMKLIENHLPPTTTKSELLNSIKKFKR